MPSLQITTRIGCRNGCSYCPQDKLISAYKKVSSNIIMSLRDFKACIDQVPVEVDVWFAGMCEPWFNPDCTQMLLYAHNKGHKISVFTTISGMRLADLKLIEAVPFGFFQVHLPSDPPQEKIKVTDTYLAILDKITNSCIKATYHCHGKNLHPMVKFLLDRKSKTGEYRSLYQRSGNIRIKNRLKRPRKRGALGCRRNMRSNVLLPNGDVLLCSNDYAMKHRLGNLLTTSYDALFKGSEFTKVVDGMKDDSLDILCRHCDNFSIDADTSATFHNFSYRVDRYFYYLRDINRFDDLEMIIKKVLRGTGKRFK